MAEASFTLRAVDATKQAFASVQLSLTKLQKSSETAAGFMKKAFDPRALGAGFAAALGLSLTSVIDSALNKLVDFVQRAKNITDSLKASSIRVSDIYAESAFDQMSLGDKIKTREDQRIEAAKEIKRLTEETAAINTTIVAPVNMGGLGSVTGVRQVVSTPQGTLGDADKLGKLREEQALRDRELGRLRADMAKVEADGVKSANDAIGKSEEEAGKQALERRKRFNDYFNKSIAESERLEQDAEKKRQHDEASAKSLQNLASAQLDILDPLRQYQREIELVNDLASKGLLTEEQSLARKRQINDEMDRTRGIIEDIIPAQIEFNQIANDAGSLIAQGFEDAILSGQKLGEVVRSLGRDLLRLVFQKTITNPLAEGISAALRIPFKAMGGPVSSGSPYVVGEKGPELFVPHASGTIVPNNKMGSSGGGGSGSVTVNYNIAAGVSRAELAPILEQERRRLKAEIPDMVRRGGGYRAAFA